MAVRHTAHDVRRVREAAEGTEKEGVGQISLRYEQYNSLKVTQRFLCDLLTVDQYPKTKREMRERASRCLRHFPFLYESGQPMWSKDEFTEDVEG